MPALRYQFHAVMRTVTNLPSRDPVAVRLKSGEYRSVSWLGLICEPAAELIAGLGYAKIRAFSITDGDGISHCTWRDVRPHEHVLGWRVLLASGNEAVYGIVDQNMWPVLVGERGKVGAPRLKLA